MSLSARRLRQLDAIGVTAYRLRSRVPTGAAAVAVDPAEVIAVTTAARVVVIGERAVDAVAKLLAAALGVPVGALQWQTPRDGKLPELDQNAAAFLVLGQPFARVLGAELPTTVQQAATIVVTSAPAEWRGNALAKRLLWQALRPLRRQLREQPWSPS